MQFRWRERSSSEHLVNRQTYGGRRRTTDVEQALAVKNLKNEMLSLHAVEPNETPDTWNFAVEGQRTSDQTQQHNR